MDMQDYGAYAQLIDTRDRIAGDPNRSLYEKVRDLGPIGQGLRSQPRRQQSSSTFGDVLRVAVGSALGYGLGKGVGSVLGFGQDRSHALASTGAMLGGLVRLTKTAEEQRLAFRTAFIKAAIDRGHFKHAFIGPLILAPALGLSGAVARIGESAGSVIGASDAPDDVDADIVRAKVETELLRHELARVRALRRNQILKDILAKRTAQ